MGCNQEGFSEKASLLDNYRLAGLVAVDMLEKPLREEDFNEAALDDPLFEIINRHLFLNELPADSRLSRWIQEIVKKSLTNV